MSYLDEEIVSLHHEIWELERSPFARKQEDFMEQMFVSTSTPFNQCWPMCVCPICNVFPVWGRWLIEMFVFPQNGDGLWPL